MPEDLPTEHMEKVREIKLAFFSDGLQLKGRLHLPDKNRPNLIIGSHGLYSSGASPKQLELASAFSRSGIAYFRFDHRGCGKSEGCFEEVTSLAGRRQDLIDAVTFLQSECPLGSGLGLFGSSLGGATCLAAAPILKPHRMVTLAAPVDSRSILSAGDQVPAVEPSFFKESLQFDLRRNLGVISGLLVVHGKCDSVIPADHAEIIYAGTRDPKSRLIIPGGDHRLSQRKHQLEFMEATLAWLMPLTQSMTPGREAPC